MGTTSIVGIIAFFFFGLFACSSSAQKLSDKYIGIKYSETYKFPFSMSEKEWKEKLDDNQYNILREKGTDRPFTGALNSNKKTGVYYSAATGEPVFKSSDKFKSGTGWPSFIRPFSETAVVLKEDNSYGMTRVEVMDSSGSHLGHVFPDGPNPTGLRYCINDTSLLFVEDGKEAPALVKDFAANHK